MVILDLERPSKVVTNHYNRLMCETYPSINIDPVCTVATVMFKPEHCLFKRSSIFLGSVGKATLQAVRHWEFSSSFVYTSLKIYLRVTLRKKNKIQLHLFRKT